MKLLKLEALIKGIRNRGGDILDFANCNDSLLKITAKLLILGCTKEQIRGIVRDYFNSKGSEKYE